MVLNEIKSLVCRFLWGSIEGHRKIHLVSRETVCLLLDLGGVDIKRISEFNIALLCKWVWRISEDSLWARLVKEKYGYTSTSSFPKFPGGAIGCNIWKGLRKAFQLFCRLICFRVGADNKVKFWLEPWCSDRPLMKVSPQLFRRCSLKVSNFAHVTPGGETNWNPNLPRRLSDTEIREFTSLSPILDSVALSEESDKLK